MLVFMVQALHVRHGWHPAGEISWFSVKCPAHVASNSTPISAWQCISIASKGAHLLHSHHWIRCSSHWGTRRDAEQPGHTTWTYSEARLGLDCRCQFCNFLGNCRRAQQAHIQARFEHFSHHISCRLWWRCLGLGNSLLMSKRANASWVWVHNIPANSRSHFWPIAKVSTINYARTARTSWSIALLHRPAVHHNWTSHR